MDEAYTIIFAIFVIVPSCNWPRLLPRLVVIRINALHLIIVIIVIPSNSSQQICIGDHLVLDLDLLILQIRLEIVVFFLVDGRKCVLRAALCRDLHIKCSRARTRTNAGEGELVDVAEFHEGGLFGNEEDILFENEEIALNGL